MELIFDALGLGTADAAAICAEPQIVNTQQWQSRFPVSELAAQSVGAVGAALAQYMTACNMTPNAAKVITDQRLASLWFQYSLQPDGWDLPPIWDAIAGIYQTRDGWIRLHTNLPHHRAAALSVLGGSPTRDAVAAAVATYDADTLETAIVQAGGVAAALRSRAQWNAHPQGQAIAQSPLIEWLPARAIQRRDTAANAARPLAGLRVLDLTRVLAGPVATRTLAGFGADILRLDPLDWYEDNVVPDITLGKHCARLDLRAPTSQTTFETLLSQADILIHGYRPDALAGLGYDLEQRQKIAPNLIEISLDAYGWTGPWATRRGFDSLVQMSTGIAHAGMGWANAQRPTPLPVQALDHATGYLMAAAALRALTQATQSGRAQNARLSLARTGELLWQMADQQGLPATYDPAQDLPPAGPDDFQSRPEITPWGPARRLRPPLSIQGTAMQWQRPASELGSSPAKWPE